MAFWDSFTGLLGPMPPMTLEGITGHAPGAFKGMTMKDFFDKDKWKREQRIGTSGIDKGKPLVNERTGEPITSNWYTGNQPAPEAFQAGIRESRPPGKEAYPQGGGVLLPSGGRDRPFSIPSGIPQQRANAVTTGRPFTPLPTPINLQRPYLRSSDFLGQQVGPMSNLERLRLRPPGSVQDIPPGSQPTFDKTIVKKTFADPAKSNTVTETIKQIGIPTTEQFAERRRTGWSPSFRTMGGLLGNTYTGLNEWAQDKALKYQSDRMMDTDLRTDISPDYVRRDPPGSVMSPEERKRRLEALRLWQMRGSGGQLEGFRREDMDMFRGY